MNDAVPAIELFGDGLDGAAGQMHGVGAWHLRDADGTRTPMDLDRWCGRAGSADASVVSRCTGPTVDVGCGPGRLTVAVARRGMPCLGVDMAPAAVALARRAGAVVLCRSVFRPLPGEGRWSTVILADGNVGIGGDPERLLRRCAALIAPDGLLVVELDPPGHPTGPVRLRIESPQGAVSTWFPWARVSVDDAGGVARSCDLRLAERWNVEGRWFATMHRS